MREKTRKQARLLAGLYEEIIVDSFAGGGGASMGIESALGRSVDVAINHDEDAILMHSANHPHTLHLREDVWKVDPMQATGGRPVGLLWASPDCFPAGTLILTTKGYIPIEKIKAGELVLTHRGRWRKVTETMTSKKVTRLIRGHGHHGLRVSDEHPFYAALKKCRMIGWVKAKSLRKGHYWSTPKSFFETAAAPAIPGRSLPFDARLWWLVGRYLACGWTRLTDTRAELVICCGRDKADYTRRMLDQWPREGTRSACGELAWHERDTATEIQFTADHRGLVEWLREHFGHLATGKRVAGWVYGLLPDARRCLLAGYLAGDGWNEGTFVECRTVSKALAYGLKTLAVSLGHVPTIYEMENTKVIEGREVDAKPIFMLRWRHAVDSKHAQTFSTCDQLFTPIREVIADGAVETVYNIGVEEDESYVAESIVVHNCKHFSRAKGGKPVEKKIRSLAWVVIKWAKLVKPRVIMLENVREFQDWGPLRQAIGADDRPLFAANGEPVLMPDKSRKGQTFRKWVGCLRKLGGTVEWRPLDAADYGAPTHRRRLFLICRFDGQPIVWPEPTHGPGRKHAYRTAAECIDFKKPCPSIYARKRPLADKTHQRIAMGIYKFVLDRQDPFIVNVQHGGDEFRGQAITEPLGAVTSKHGYGVVLPSLVQTGYGERDGQEPRCMDVGQPLGTIVAGGQKHAVATPILSRYNGQKGDESRCIPVDGPLGTQDTSNRYALLTPVLVECANSNWSDGTRPADCPAPTVTAHPKGGSWAVACPVLVGAGGSVYAGKPRAVDRPMGVVKCDGHQAVATAFLAKHYGGVVGQDMRKPIGTVTAVDHHSVVAAHLAKFRGDSPGGDLADPAPTITSGAGAARPAGAAHAMGVAAVHLQKFYGTNVGSDVRQPCPTVTATGQHAGACSAFIIRYFGQGVGQGVDEPKHTSTCRDRDGLMTVNLDGGWLLSPQMLARAKSLARLVIRVVGIAKVQPHLLWVRDIAGGKAFPLLKKIVSGAMHLIYDVGLRMLAPRELATAQGFPLDYILTGSNSSQVARIGNSVCPVMAKVLAAANCGDMAAPRKGRKVAVAA